MPQIIACGFDSLHGSDCLGGCWISLVCYHHGTESGDWHHQSFLSFPLNTNLTANWAEHHRGCCTKMYKLSTSTKVLEILCNCLLLALTEYGYPPERISTRSKVAYGVCLAQVSVTVRLNISYRGKKVRSFETVNCVHVLGISYQFTSNLSLERLCHAPLQNRVSLACASYNLPILMEKQCTLWSELAGWSECQWTCVGSLSAVFKLHLLAMSSGKLAIPVMTFLFEVSDLYPNQQTRRPDFLLQSCQFCCGFFGWSASRLVVVPSLP